MEKEIIALLSQTEIFKNISVDILKGLAHQLIVTEFADGKEIFRRGDIGDSMYVITDGKVKVHDDEHTLAHLGKGDFFGEIALFDSSPRSLTVTAVEKLSVIIITKDKLFGFLKDKPEVIMLMMHQLVQRMRNLDETIIAQLRSREIELERMVDERTSALVQKNEELIAAMLQLQKTQEQLIAQQKLASLGQLTAGIAHEIQNPLNFITNFSSLSIELLTEVIELQDEAEKKEVITELKGNLEKINNHGKRADDIVKGMLMHSRSRNSEKQASNINKLCGDAINFSYQGMKGKSNDFTCTIEKKFTENLPSVKLVEQDISRVLLNLLNNAFYAVSVRTKKEAAEGTDYTPTVSISTELQDKKIKIVVRDNGSGIPASIKEKIFQPFFTTKSGTDGTGLGLSISYDIVKSHGGEMHVESVENTYTEFIITIPV